MVQKPKYLAMLRYAKDQVQQLAEQGSFSINSKLFSLAAVEVAGRKEKVRDQEAQDAWPSIVAALGLVEDGYGGWTLEGHGVEPPRVQFLNERPGHCGSCGGELDSEGWCAHYCMGDG